MASPGYHKDLKSTNPLLEVKRAGKDHPCCGTYLERGARPGPLQDVWQVGRSYRCIGTIKRGSFYVANKLLSPTLRSFLSDYGGWIPTCMFCAVDAYSEFFEGPKKVEFMKPMTPEKRQRVIEGLVRAADELTARKVVP